LLELDRIDRVADVELNRDDDDSALRPWKEEEGAKQDTHLEDDVFGKDVLDARDDVLGLALGKLDRLHATLEHRTVRSQLGHLGKLLRVRRLTLGRAGL
jgi:hypothetical protein